MRFSGFSEKVPGPSSSSTGYSKVRMAQEAHRIINSSPIRRHPRTMRRILYRIEGME
jgi:hypothetical protein